MVKELNLKVAKAWAAKEAFAQFWEFRCPGKARAFFNHWRRWVGRLKLEPLTKVSNMLKKHLKGLLSYALYPISNAEKVQRVMARLIEEYGAPEHIRSDNGSEFIEKNLREWLSREGIKSLYIEPGSPWQNGYIESFHARFREECLNRRGS